MKVFVDADACPVRDIICREAYRLGIHVSMVVSMAHDISEQAGMEMIRVDSSFQAVDMAIMNRVVSGDIVVTSDFGLAAMVLGKGSRAISPSGRIFSETNINELLEKRHYAAKQRRAGGKVKGPKARKKENDDAFRRNFIRLLEDRIRQGSEIRC